MHQALTNPPVARETAKKRRQGRRRKILFGSAGAVLLLIMVEVLNTGIEAACDAFSREFNVDIQLAKDCGSLAVLISVLIVAGVWGIAIIERITGLPI